jgi:hypothetical protein
MELGRLGGAIMGVCPVCNGFQRIEEKCPACQNTIEDQGRVMDYFDDYSPYMQIDLMKLEDGLQDDFEKGKCPHLLKCSQCGYEKTYLIKE